MIKKVGITCIVYNDRKNLTRALEPWLEIVKNPSLVGIESLQIQIGVGVFIETFQLGFPIKSEDGTAEYVKELLEKGLISGCEIYDVPQIEYEMWTRNYHKMDVDFLVMLNSDELWTIGEIKKAINYANTNTADFYKIDFKNYCIDYGTYQKNFIVPRMWRIRLNDTALRGFYKDDLVDYTDNTQDFQHYSLVVEGVEPKHESWVGPKEYLKRKLGFQALRYGICSYRWNDKEDKLELNPDYYKMVGKPLPELIHE